VPREGFTIEQIACAMEKAQIDPAMIYAFRKTGFIPSERNVDLFSDEEMARWDAAIAEFESLKLMVTGAGA
jgi:hypothetical protein